MIVQTYTTTLNQNCPATYVWAIEGNSLGVLIDPAGSECTVTINESMYTSGSAELVCTATCGNCSSQKKYPINYASA